MVRAFGGLPEAFQGRCEVLEDLADETTHCRFIEAQKHSPAGQLWLAHYIDETCNVPEMRKEICATVHA